MEKLHNAGATAVVKSRGLKIRGKQLANHITDINSRISVLNCLKKNQEVRNSKITREEAVYLVKKFDGEFPEKYLKEFIDYINISEDEFYRVVDKFRSPHLWMCDGNKWSLRHIICN